MRNRSLQTVDVDEAIEFAQKRDLRTAPTWGYKNAGSDKTERCVSMAVTAGQEGGCQCGAIRYRLLRPPIALYACHCLDCQKQSSSAFGMSLWVERDSIEFTGKEPRIFHARGGSGEPKQCAFCPDCGTRLYHASSAVGPAGALSVKAGSLDDTSRLKPTSHLWTKRAQVWLRALINAETHYQQEPESGASLIAQWKQQAQTKKK